jgi:hypothetical protein
MPDGSSPGFDGVLRRAAEAAASEWRYAAPSEEFYEHFAAHIPEDTRAEIARGVREHRVVIDGYRFRLPNLGPKKGPYAFFSRNRGPGVPSPNWEYFVQVAEYLRILRTVRAGLRVGFEDGLMDVSVRDDQRLIWYIEAKEQPSQAGHLVDGLADHSAGVDMKSSDRGNDPLRKAKYLVKYRPVFLTVIAIGWRRDYAVQYPNDQSFTLIPLAEAPPLGEVVHA